MTSIAAIEAAALRLRGRARTTPLLEAPLLSELAGRRLLVKAECLQLTGSFTFRGAWSALTALPAAARARGVLGFSSGNHAQGVALAARLLGVPAAIVMPRDAPAPKIEATRAYGAEVILYDRAGGESREAIGARLVEGRGLALVRPYDDPEVIAGQGSCGLEIAAEATAAGIAAAEVLVPCGGGGLASGIALALAARAPGLRVRTAEPLGFDDTLRSLAAGRRVQNAAPSGSLCDAIVTPQPGEITFPILARLAGPGLAVSDEEALRAMAVAFRHLRIVLEPGGAVALAAALGRAEELGTGPVIAVASGGNVEPALFADCLRRYG
ncbi:MAG: threonine/serine dehydratase [Rhodobacteraceae bacterium]|nr:threonine/serine dehydratase [Paracoccaceae bacterium]